MCAVRLDGVQLQHVKQGGSSFNTSDLYPADNLLQALWEHRMCWGFFIRGLEL